MSGENLTLRSVEAVDIPEATALVWSVFLEFEAPGYSKEGIDEFRRFLDDIPKNVELRMIGCWKNDALVGLIAVRPPCHIALLFVDKAHHRRGIARLLWQTVLADASLVGGHTAVTVHSSPYAVGVYKRLGFIPTDAEQTINGIRFVPMRYEK